MTSDRLSNLPKLFYVLALVPSPYFGARAGGEGFIHSPMILTPVKLHPSQA